MSEALQELWTLEMRSQPTQDTSGYKLSQVSLIGYKRGESLSTLSLCPLELAAGGRGRRAWRSFLIAHGVWRTESCAGKASTSALSIFFFFTLFGGTQLIKEQRRIQQFLSLPAHHYHRNQNCWFVCFQSSFKDLSSSMYFSVTKLPETCSIGCIYSPEEVPSC